MKFDYLVKHNGIYYPAGTDVPIETNGGDTAPVDVSGKVDIESEAPVETEVKTEEIPVETEVETEKKRKYSEEDLNVPHAALKAMARKEGLKVPNTIKSEQIRDMLRAL